MKLLNLIVIFSLLLFANSVFAALEIKGTVPEIPPVQSAPIGISPNINDNIQRTDEVIKPQAENQNVIDQSASNNSLDLAEISEIKEMGFEKSNIWIWWVVIILGFVVLGFWIKKNKEKI